MNAERILTDAVFNSWLHTRAGDGAPIGLVDEIAVAVARTEQSRPQFWLRLLRPVRPTPAQRVASVLVLVGVLLAATVSTALVEPGVMRWLQEQVIVPHPSAVPATPTPAISQPLPPITLVPIGSAETTATELGKITWHRYERPASLTNVTVTPFGLAALDGYDFRWSEDGVTWPGISLSIGPWRLSRIGNDLFAYGRSAVRLAWDGRRWAEVDRLDVSGLGTGTIRSIVAGPKGFVMETDTGLFSSTDGHEFVPAARGLDADLLGPAATPPGPDHPDFEGGCVPIGSGYLSSTEGTTGEPIVFATADGFVALTPRHRVDWWGSPVCEPVVWFSSDGRDWRLQSTESPFGPGVDIASVVMRDGRFVAFSSGLPGGPGVGLWTSENGMEWTRVDDLAVIPEALGAGGLGWLVVERSVFLDGQWQTGPVAWVSRDGLSWSRVPANWPGVEGTWLAPEVSIGSNVVVVSGASRLDSNWVNTIVVGTLAQ